MRHSHIVSRENGMLLVVDFQKKLLAAFKEPERFIANCCKLIKFAKILKLPIVWTEQYPRGLGRTTEAIRDELADIQPVEKLTFSCFGEPGFVDSLARKSAKQLIICGIETHICVEQTVLDGIACGYQMHVVADACGSRRKQDHEAGLHKMEKAGAVLTSAEMVMYEILEGSHAPEFRDVLQLVK